MTLIQARIHECLAGQGVSPAHRARYVSQITGLPPDRAAALLAGTLPDLPVESLAAIANALDVPTAWLVLPLDAVATPQ